MQTHAISTTNGRHERKTHKVLFIKNKNFFSKTGQRFWYTRWLRDFSVRHSSRRHANTRDTRLVTAAEIVCTLAGCWFQFGRDNNDQGHCSSKMTLMDRKRSSRKCFWTWSPSSSHRITYTVRTARIVNTYKNLLTSSCVRLPREYSEIFQIQLNPFQHSYYICMR